MNCDRIGRDTGRGAVYSIDHMTGNIQDLDSFVMSSYGLGYVPTFLTVPLEVNNLRDIPALPRADPAGPYRGGLPGTRHSRRSTEHRLRYRECETSTTRAVMRLLKSRRGSSVRHGQCLSLIHI